MPLTGRGRGIRVSNCLGDLEGGHWQARLAENQPATMCDALSLPWRKPYRCPRARISPPIVIKHGSNRLSQHRDPPIDLRTMVQQFTQLMLHNSSNTCQVRLFCRLFDDLHPNFSNPQALTTQFDCHPTFRALPGCVCVAVMIPNAMLSSDKASGANLRYARPLIETSPNNRPEIWSPDEFLDITCECLSAVKCF